MGLIPGEFRIKALVHLVFGEGQFWGFRYATITSGGRRVENLSGAPFIKMLIPFTMAPNATIPRIRFRYRLQQ